MTMPAARRLPLLLCTLLAACGTIPTPTVTLPDTTVPLSNSFLASGQVVYVDRDGLEGSGTLPAALQGLTIRGNALYNARGGTLGTVQLYVRSTLSDLPASCSTVPGGLFGPAMYTCDPDGETAQAIGTVTVKAGSDVPFTLSGPALDAAAKGGRGYFGFRVVSGTALDGESVALTDLRAQARL